jgi:hypothetical protein
VARLNYFAGTVTLEPAGLTDWSYAVLNRPLTTGDQLWADANARAELHAGSTALRLDQQTALDIVNLNDTTTQLKVTQGTLSAHVRALPAGQNFEIDTPNVALVATSPGLFRVDVAADGSSTMVTLRAGNATLYGDGGSFQMSAGQQIQFVGSNLQQRAAGSAPALDAFDQWIASRDRAEDNSISARYVSREIPGYEDLDANGTWRSVPNYGEVWVPTTVTTGWAPYHEGHWAWVAPWGWTWVDDAPWGFAPFHYGRWAYIDRSWAWVPGPVVVTQPPVYAPALVAFVGGGGGGGAHWGVDLAIGGAIGAGVAWFALGPGEPWHPAYHYSPTYYNRINNVNITNVHNTTTTSPTSTTHTSTRTHRAPSPPCPRTLSCEASRSRRRLDRSMPRRSPMRRSAQERRPSRRFSKALPVPCGRPRSAHRRRSRNARSWRPVHPWYRLRITTRSLNALRRAAARWRARANRWCAPQLPLRSPQRHTRANRVRLQLRQAFA